MKLKLAEKSSEESVQANVSTFQPTPAHCRSAGLAVAGVVGAQDSAHCCMLNMRYVFFCSPSPSCCVVFVVFLCCMHAVLS